MVKGREKEKKKWLYCFRKKSSSLLRRNNIWDLENLWVIVRKNGDTQPMRKKTYQMLYWGNRPKFKGNRKAEFPSKPRFAFTATIVVRKDVMTMFVGLVVFRAAFIQQGHAIFNLQPIFLSAPSFMGFKTQQGRGCFPEQIPFFPYSFSDNHCTNKASSDGIHPGHCWPLPAHCLITSQEFYKRLLFYLRGCSNSTVTRENPGQSNLGFCIISNSKGKMWFKRSILEFF